MVTQAPPREELTLPHNRDAEESILGGVLVTHGQALDAVADRLKPADFYSPAHQQIFAAMLALYGRSVPIDYVTLVEELRRSNKLEAVGGVAYVTGLDEGVPRGVNMQAYARIIRDKAIARNVIYAANRMLAAAYEQDTDAAALVNQAEQALLEVSGDAVPGELKSARQMVDEIYPVIEALTTSRKPVTGLSTGFPSLDRFTRGLQPGSLAIVAARPSQGKTTLATQIALHAATSVNVAFFSIEMEQQEQMFRVLSHMARVDGHLLQCGQLPMHQQQDLGIALNEFAERRFWLDDSSMLSATQIRSRSRRLKHQHGLGLIFVDYLQLMEHPAADRQDLRVAATTRRLKQLARELSVPVVVLSQLNRASESRGDKRPQLADLRESGSIEQDADLVLLLHHGAAEKGQPSPPTELIIAKQRNGPKGVVELEFRGAEYRFVEIEGQ